MGFLSGLKSVFFGDKTDEQTIDINVYLENARASLRQASDSLGNFLHGVKGFTPARRHEQLFGERIFSRTNLIRAWAVKGIAFLDAKLTNSFDTNNNVKSTNQLSMMIGDWVKVIKFEQLQQSIPDNAQKNVIVYTNPYLIGEENVQEEKLPEDILGILRKEIWDEKKIPRGFPIPNNKELLYNYLENAFGKLKEAKSQLDEYNTYVVQQNT